MTPFPYSQDYLPPAPVLAVHVAVPEESARLGPYTALVDTGSDGTFVPLVVLEQLGVPVAFQTRTRSHLGDEPQLVLMFTIDLWVGDSMLLPGIDVAGDRWGNEIILGRDVLNRLQILLDGRAATLNLLD